MSDMKWACLICNRRNRYWLLCVVIHIKWYMKGKSGCKFFLIFIYFKNKMNMSNKISFFEYMRWWLRSGRGQILFIGFDNDPTDMVSDIFVAKSVTAFFFTVLGNSSGTASAVCSTNRVRECWRKLIQSMSRMRAVDHMVKQALPIVRQYRVPELCSYSPVQSKIKAIHSIIFVNFE